MYRKVEEVEESMARLQIIHKAISITDTLKGMENNKEEIKKVLKPEVRALIKLILEFEDTYGEVEGADVVWSAVKEIVNDLEN